jgi:uncharacterized protein (TIGR02246 family)
MKAFVSYVTFALLTACFTGGQPAQAQSKDEQAIRALEDQFAAAFRAKDTNAIMKVYVPGSDLFVFDVVPPRQYAGSDAYQEDWKKLFDALRGPVQFEIADLSITTDGKLAYSHSIQHVAGTNLDGSPMEMTVRVTDCYRKMNGKWLIAVEHISVPVDISTGKADLTSKP